jgi:ABC-type glycerol-3-phosphate transport system substrate-binding protein
MPRVGVLLIVISFILVSCGQPSASPTPAVAVGNTTAEEALPVNPNMPTKPVSLEVWVDLDFTRENTFFEEIANDFERAYPHVNVEVYSFVREGILQRMEHVSKDELPPNVVQGHVYTAAGLGLAEPLESYWQEWEKKEPALQTQFLPSTLNEVTWQGVRYGVPLDVYTVVLLYNQQHFDEAHLPYPNGSYDLYALRRTAAALTNPAKTAMVLV